MNDVQKKMEAVGDGLLLAIARMCLRERFPQIEYKLYTPLVSTLTRNRTLERIAQDEGIHFGSKAADAFEREIARRFYRALPKNSKTALDIAARRGQANNILG